MNDKPTVRLTPHQLAAMLVLEGQIAQLQVGANQLGGFLGLKDEADILIGAMEFIGQRKVALQKSWDKTIQLATPADVPGLVRP